MCLGQLHVLAGSVNPTVGSLPPVSDLHHGDQDCQRCESIPFHFVRAVCPMEWFHVNDWCKGCVVLCFKSVGGVLSLCVVVVWAGGRGEGGGEGRVRVRVTGSVRVRERGRERGSSSVAAHQFSILFGHFGGDASAGHRCAQEWQRAWTKSLKALQHFIESVGELECVEGLGLQEKSG